MVVAVWCAPYWTLPCCPGTLCGWLWGGGRRALHSGGVAWEKDVTWQLSRLHCQEIWWSWSWSHGKPRITGLAREEMMNRCSLVSDEAVFNGLTVHSCDSERCITGDNGDLEVLIQLVVDQADGWPKVQDGWERTNLIRTMQLYGQQQTVEVGTEAYLGGSRLMFLWEGGTSMSGLATVKAQLQSQPPLSLLWRNLGFLQLQGLMHVYDVQMQKQQRMAQGWIEWCYVTSTLAGYWLRSRLSILIASVTYCMKVMSCSVHDSSACSARLSPSLNTGRKAGSFQQL